MSRASERSCGAAWAALAAAVALSACGARDRARADDARVEPSTPPHIGPPASLRVNEPGDAAAVAADSDVTGSGTSYVTDSENDDTLIGEERERDPRSRTVTIKITVDPRRAAAHVVWGRKDFGAAPLEIERPRDSGPLDLVVVAPGYLPLHARAFTDRDDVLALRIYAPAEAPQLLGYRAGAASANVVFPPPSPPSARDGLFAAQRNSRQNRPENSSDVATKTEAKAQSKTASKSELQKSQKKGPKTGPKAGQ